MKSLSRIAAAGFAVAGSFPAVAALPRDVSTILESRPAECYDSGRYLFSPMNTLISRHPVFFDCQEGRTITVSCRAVFEAWSQTQIMASMDLNAVHARKDMGQFSRALELCS